MSEVSNENIALAKMARDAFGGTAKVRRYYDEKEEKSVDILTSEDEKLLSYATIGLSDSPLYIDGKEYEVRVELVGASYANIDYFPNVLATAAFNIMNSKWECYPGVIFDNIISMYDSSIEMKHLLFVPPFVWDNRLETIEFENKKVAWLQIIPISDEERSLALEKSSEALEELLEQSEVDVYNILRQSIV
ncbi:suppressor of fused domain protein [Sulfurimonas sp. HSL-3221]|uniref:suppressor of fused domain protein n=1 Tax=Sulfurimonadaceae TaxID=2771471 RepID=UPI001E43CB3E|nr:suppressor of fused domain protein [Sulfurimonas sp. HSL-3221]UFS62741.1 suppressor of fused domain protein [Sulfurimonas sp. HSL-3221]